MATAWAMAVFARIMSFRTNLNAGSLYVNLFGRALWAKTMNARYVVWAGLSAMAVFLAIGIGWFFSLPTASVVGTPPPIPENEARLMLAALQPPKRQRPVVAIIAINDATETTDYFLPYGSSEEHTSELQSLMRT